jgi:7,8-dihydroneopterin aldolase/epimerase/oxygenase
MVTIHLHELIFFAQHGIYKEEKEKGNRFEVKLDVLFKNRGNKFGSIEQTINYEDLFSIVQEEMLIATPLLEKVCQAIINSIKKKHPSVKEISITIYKLNPPIKGFKGRVGVTIIKKFR